MCIRDRNVGSIQGYFTHQIEQYLAEKGRRVIGWDEMLEKGVQPTTNIISWRGTAPGFKAAELGHDVVILSVIHISATTTLMRYFLVRCCLNFHIPWHSCLEFLRR